MFLYHYGTRQQIGGRGLPSRQGKKIQGYAEIVNQQRAEEVVLEKKSVWLTTRTILNVLMALLGVN